MCKQLPLELLHEIGRYLDDAYGHSASCFTRYALVCRQWQSAFEPFIYKTLRVHSTDFRTGKGVISLSQLQSLRPSRCAMIRVLEYRVVVPYDLPDYESAVPVAIRHASGGRGETSQYTEDNPIRRANNEAFQLGVIKLFNIIGSWDHRFTLRPAILGRDRGHEPETEMNCEAGTFLEIRRGDRWAIRPYRARFLDGDVVPNVSCINRLAFGPWARDINRIWATAALQIAQSCIGLNELYWGTMEQIRPDHEDYMRKRRQELGEGLPNLPHTLKVFEYRNRSEEVWYASTPAPRLFNEIDSFSVNLRALSTRLEELRLHGVALPLDFLWPLEGSPSAVPVEWPYLRVFVVDDADIFLPSGEWIADPTPEDLEENHGATFDSDDESEYGATVEFITNGCHYPRKVLKLELCHQHSISLGYAVQHMPRLVMMEYQFTLDPDHAVKVSIGPNRQATVTWKSQSDFVPDERVAAAWGFRVEDIEPSGAWGRESKVTFASWPPKSPIGYTAK